MKLSVRISLLTGLLILAITFAAGFTAIMVSSDIVENTAWESLENQAASGADLVKVRVNGQLMLLEEFASRNGVTSMHTENLDGSIVAGIDRAGFLDIALVGYDGNAHYIKDKSVAYLGDREYVKNALLGRQDISDVLISRVTGQPVLMFAVPVKDAAGGVAGALVGRMDGNTLSEVTKSVKFGKSGYAYIVNENGTFISHPNGDMVNKQYNPLEAVKTDSGVVSLAGAMRSILENDRGHLTYRFNGRDIYAGYTPIEGYPWKLVATAERSELFQGISRLTMIIAGAGAILILIGIAIANLIGRSVAKPLNIAA